jgi:hypothetical protein
MMIFMAFYAYDRCLLEHSAYQAALSGAYDHHYSADEAATKAKQAAAVLVNGRVFAVKDLDYSVAVDAGSVTVTYHCVVNMPFIPWIGQYVSGFSDEYMTFDVSKSASRMDAVMEIRTYRSLKKLGGGLMENNNENGGENE